MKAISLKYNSLILRLIALGYGYPEVGDESLDVHKSMDGVPEMLSVMNKWI
jgi:hypothetical protein